jgi:DNA polymerase III epsilon subunit-like protein
MSNTLAFYFLLHETTNSSTYSWRREYLKLSLGKVCRLEKVVEYENKTIYRPTGLAFGLPFGVKLSSKLEYTQALLRYRKDAAVRKRLAEIEKEQRKLADKKLNGIRGLGPAPKLPPLQVSILPEVVPGTGLFDDFTIVDTEYQHDVLLEVAAIRYKNWQPVEEYVSFVRYTGWVSPFTTQHTGITEADVRRAPTEKAVLQALAKLAGDSLLIAHNIGADRSKLKLACERQGLEELPNKWFCTMALARARLPKGVKSGLTDLCDRFKFSNKGAHRALSDVGRTFQVLRHFYQEDPITTLDPKARKAAPTLFAA